MTPVRRIVFAPAVTAALAVTLGALPAEAQGNAPPRPGIPTYPPGEDQVPDATLVPDITTGPLSRPA